MIPGNHDLDCTPTDLTGNGGYHLRGYRWQPSGPIRGLCIIAHGKDEHIGRYQHVVAALAMAGFVVYGHDHRGHGQSDGARGVITRFDDYVDDLDLLVEHASREYPDQPVVLIGHSMGGLIAARYALAHQSKLAGLILSGPALLIGEKTPWWQTRLVLLLGRFFPDRPLPVGQPSTLSRNPQVDLDFAADPLVNHKRTTVGFVRALYLAAEDARPRGAEVTIPLLLMHGTADQLTSPKGSQAWFDNAPSEDKTLKLWPDAHHEIFNEINLDDVIAYMLTWLDERFPSQ